VHGSVCIKIDLKYVAQKTASSQHVYITNQTLAGLSYNYSVWGSKQTLCVTMCYKPR